jgi:hypothetical protein
VATPGSETHATFTKTFTITGTTLDSAVLDIATDNSYSVKINGVTVPTPTGSDADNFSLGTQDHYNVASFLHLGSNTLEVTVSNWGVDGASTQSNPAGLLYKITAVSNDCPGQTPCLTPSALGGPEHVTLGSSPEETLQSILTGAGYALNADTDQQNIQEWTAANKTVHFDVKFIKGIADAGRVFGYYLNNDLSTFVPLIKALYKSYLLIFP